MGDPWKGYKVFFRDNLFEEDMIVFRTNSYHSLFRQLKKCLILDTDHLWVTSDPMELNGDTINI